MYEAKTKPTKISVESHLLDIADETRRKDCHELCTLMQGLTGCAPRMWGPSIIGFDSYRYTYESGHQGESCLVGFASGKAHISIYLISGYEAPETQALLARLGKHKTGKGCLYIKRLSDVQIPILEELISRSIVQMRKRYPANAN